MRDNYGPFEEHQIRVITNTLDSYFSENFTQLGGFEHGNYCYASAQAGIHMQSWNYGITIDIHEFNDGEREKIKSRVERIVGEGQNISENDAEKLNFIKMEEVITS